MTPGVSDTNVIDLVSRNPRTGAFTLIMVQDRAWDGLAEHLYELQQKVNSYLSFALDGELRKKYPDSADRSAPLQLECDKSRDPTTDKFIGQLRGVTGKYGIEFIVNVR